MNLSKLCFFVLKFESSSMNDFLFDSNDFFCFLNNFNLWRHVKLYYLSNYIILYLLNITNYAIVVVWLAKWINFSLKLIGVSNYNMKKNVS
jgi:hypothetical protein